MFSPEAKVAVGSILTAVLHAGCQLFSPELTPPAIPTSTPEPPPTTVPATPTPTRGEKYDQLVARLSDTNLELFYTTLRGSDLFETRADFLARNRGAVSPIHFKWSDGKQSFIAYGGGFLPNAVVFEDYESRTFIFCAPGSEAKRSIFQGIVDEFEGGEQVDKRLVVALMDGMSPNCAYFIEEGTGNAPKNPEEARGKRG